MAFDMQQFIQKNRGMFLKGMGYEIEPFRSAECPTLLEMIAGIKARNFTGEVKRHIGECDFCRLVLPTVTGNLLMFCGVSTDDQGLNEELLNRDHSTKTKESNEELSRRILAEL